MSTNVSFQLLPITQHGLDRRRLFRVLDHIEANLEGTLTIDTMASVACLSRYHFSRAFKKAVGQTPHRYVTGRRLERAKALLSTGHRSLVDISLALGFSSQANFTRAFTRAIGQAPGRFRERNGSQSFVVFWTPERIELLTTKSRHSFLGPVE